MNTLQTKVTLAGLENPVDLITLAGANGLQAKILALGGAVVSLHVPGRDGRLDDVVLGFGDLSMYRKNPPFLGVLIGRYGNRIASGDLRLEGKSYRLPVNDGPHQLHGGPGGFHTLLWQVADLVDGNEPALLLKQTSPDGDQGFPGKLDVEVRYTLTRECGLRVDYQARTDKLTAVNMTQHSYFNLAGHASGSIEHHLLRLAASRYLPADQTMIPTGELRPVGGTPFDFTTPTAIGAHIGANDQQLIFGKGYDHCFVVDGWDRSLREVAVVDEPRTGRRMTMRTTEPGFQLYSGNHLGGILGKDGAAYPGRTGFCLEAQRFPDSPHHPEFPSAELRPGDTYRQTTEYVFSIV